LEREVPVVGWGKRVGGGTVRRYAMHNTSLPAALFSPSGTRDAWHADAADETLEEPFGAANGHDDDVIGLDRRIGDLAGQDCFQIDSDPVSFLRSPTAKHGHIAVIGQV